MTQMFTVANKDFKTSIITMVDKVEENKLVMNERWKISAEVWKLFFFLILKLTTIEHGSELSRSMCASILFNGKYSSSTQSGVGWIPGGETLDEGTVWWEDQLLSCVQVGWWHQLPCCSRVNWRVPEMKHFVGRLGNSRMVITRESISKQEEINRNSV